MKQSAGHTSIPASTTSTKGKDKYSYTITPADLQREQQAFQAGKGVRKLHYSTCLLLTHSFMHECLHRNRSLLMALECTSST